MALSQIVCYSISDCAIFFVVYECITLASNTEKLQEFYNNE